MVNNNQQQQQHDEGHEQHSHNNMATGLGDPIGSSLYLSLSSFPSYGLLEMGVVRMLST